MKKPGMTGLFCVARLLRRDVQWLRGRDRNGLHAIHIALDFFEHGARRRWLFGLLWLALLGYDAGVGVAAQNRLIPADARHEIARETDQLVVFVEQDAHAFLLAFAAAWLQAVQVIPTIGVKRVDQQRVAHDKPYLPTGHSGP